MGKWYQISLSLAAKCRVGFALAVLLIIGGALFVPYRWMNKLVEQGKLELARAEVEQVLARHFRPINDPGVLTDKPPLTLETGGNKSIRPGRWTAVQHDAANNQAERETYVAVPRAEGEDVSEARLNEILAEKPLTSWIRLGPVGAAQEGISGSVAAPETKPDLTLREGEGTIRPAEVEEKDKAAQFPGDSFVQRGIRRLLKEKDQESVFKLYEPGTGLPSDSPGGAPQEEGIMEKLGFSLPKKQPARYLHAVRANTSCLAGGCHLGEGKAATEAQVETNRPPVFREGELVGVISVVLPAGQTSTTLLFNRIFIIAAGLMASIIAVVTFYLMMQRFILQPVRSLREAADHVAIAQEAKDTQEAETESWQEAMTITEKIKTRDEFERLARAFNQMLARLKLAHDRLRESNRALDLQLGELQAKNIALFESNRLKSEFLANVSHELRTPLNAILGFAEILREQARQREDEKTAHYTSNILESGQGLLAIINNLLDLVKIEAGKVEVYWQECSLREIAEALLNFTRPLAERKQLQVQLHIAENVGLIETDPGKLQQILFNLLSNAIKFTPAQGHIRIDAQRVEDNYVRIAVADSGPGIGPEDRQAIFEKFRQIDASVTREHSGTGLGLAIVKELTDILGGTVEVGGAVGQGAVFIVTLPVRQPVAAQQELT